MSEGIRERVAATGELVWEIDNPARKNAIGPRALAWIARRCRELRGEIVVLAGAGEGPFCSGFDLTALGEIDERGAPDAVLVAATDAMAHADATWVASIAGHAIGAGVELACACDLRIAGDDASFEVPAARLGVVYHADGIVRMKAVFGAGLVERLLLLGERVDAREAVGCGAALRVVARERLREETAAVVGRLRELAPMSVRAHREILRAARGRIDAEAIAAHEAARAAAYGSDDHREARAAVRERRPPRFSGR
jgi:enoyl-CoA hydratase/carnithine racemase